MRIFSGTSLHFLKELRPLDEKFLIIGKECVDLCRKQSSYVQDEEIHRLLSQESAVWSPLRCHWFHSILRILRFYRIFLYEMPEIVLSIMILECRIVGPIHIFHALVLHSDIEDIHSYWCSDINNSELIGVYICIKLCRVESSLIHIENQETDLTVFKNFKMRTL